MIKMLAIIIPYYKLIFFRETLLSLAAQTDQRFNVYIGNDASPENPNHLLKEFKGKFNFTYKKFEENLGSISLTKQWDRCIQMMVDEEWFMILGDDDYLSSNAVHEFYKNIAVAKKENINVVKLNSVIVNENGCVILEKKPEPYIKSSIEHFFDKFIYEGRSSLSEHIFRKPLYAQYGFAVLPFGWHADDMALLEFSEFGKIMFLGDSKCFVRVSSTSISGNPDKNKSEKWYATKLFFERVCQNLTYFNSEQKRKLFDLIQWNEKEKNIKISIPSKWKMFYRCYGWRFVLKIIQ